MSTDLIQSHEQQHLHVIARDPSEMVKAQKGVILWCARKIQAEKDLLADAQENLATADKNKWRKEPWRRRVRLSEKRIDYYKKIKAALEAGYYIVPPFPVDIFAIRTDRKKPTEGRTTYRYGAHDQTARLLPQGAGEYVSDQPEVWQTDKTRTKDDGTPETYREFYATKFLPVDFPFTVVRPEIIDATTKAMALKLFDEIGVLPQRRSADPIVLGRIKSPQRNREPVTFFIAWWLDTEDL